MKRNLIYAAALALVLFCLAGCSGEQEQSAPPPVSPSDLQVVQPAPAVDELPAPPEEPQQEIEEPAVEEPPYEMTSGVWLAATDVGYSNYYYFDAQARTGSYVSLEYGLGMPFSYDGDGTELIFHLEGHELEKPALVEHMDEESFTLVWEDSLPEKLSFVSEGTLEDFHFYSNNDLAMLALEYYADNNPETPSQVGSMTNDASTVTVQLYDNLGDHNSTAAWYIVDRFTATGTDLLTGEEIDLLPEEPVEEPQPEEPAEDVPDFEPLPDEETAVEVYAENQIP